MDITAANILIKYENPNDLIKENLLNTYPHVMEIRSKFPYMFSFSFTLCFNDIINKVNHIHYKFANEFIKWLDVNSGLTKTEIANHEQLLLWKSQISIDDTDKTIHNIVACLTFLRKIGLLKLQQKRWYTTDLCKAYLIKFNS